MKALLVLAAAVATTAHAGMYDQPYALVEWGDPSDVRKEARVAISQVDGKSTRSTRRTDPIEPGKHVITLHFESARGIFRPERRDIELTLEPCTRYRIVAHYESKTGPDWTPKVYSEAIGECARKFARAAAPR